MEAICNYHYRKQQRGVVGMSAIDEEISAAGVAAWINYLTGLSPVNRRFVAAGVEINTGHYAPQRVRIRNGRPFRRRLGFHSHGFQLVRRPSRVSDFFDRAQVDAIYPGEVVEAVQELTGANAWCRGPMTVPGICRSQQKTVGYTHQGGVQPPTRRRTSIRADRARRLATMLYEGGAGAGLRALHRDQLLADVFPAATGLAWRCAMAAASMTRRHQQYAGSRHAARS
jgi:hypothetical protein